MTPQVILLAAGKSSRAWPITEKVLFRFLGKTVIEHQIGALKTVGLSQICVVGNSENILFLKEVCGAISGVTCSFAVQNDLSEGIRGGVLAAESQVGGDKPLLIVCSNDVVEKSAYEKILYNAEISTAKIFLVGKIVDNYFPGGYLCVQQGNEKKQIKTIIEKPTPGTEPSNLVTVLIHLHKHPGVLFSALRNTTHGDGYEEVLQELFDAHYEAEAVEYSGFWQPIKYPWHLLALGEYFLKTIRGQVIHPGAQIAATAVIKGNVIIEDGVKVFDHAVINGPAYIGKNTIVANHVLVRESSIENNCVIGHTTEVARSVLQKNCWTHQNFVGDSIFDTNVSLGAGTRTANLRLDEQNIYSVIKDEKLSSARTKLGCIIGKNVRIGINSSVMPGIKIGQGSFLGAGGLYHKDIPENTYIYPKSVFTSHKNTSIAVEREEF